MEKNREASNMGGDSLYTPDVRSISGNEISSPCGENGQSLSTTFSTKKVGLASHLYLGVAMTECLYLGGDIYGYF